MIQFDNLAEFYLMFGSNAQEVLDFISNEENIRKFQAAQLSASLAETVDDNQLHIQPTGVQERSDKTSIFIALSNNRFVSKWSWENCDYSKDDVIGIAVQTPAVSFIVGLTEWEAKWSDNNDTLITKRHTEAQALQVISGLEATRKIVEEQSGEEETAAKLCWNYGHKDLQWYLPSLLELNAMCAYQDEINELMALVGGTPLSTGYRWSSTEYSAINSWLVGFNDGNSFSNGKFFAYIVRPVTKH